MASSTERTVVLISCDGQRHEVKERTARVFRALDAMIESLGQETDEPIPLQNVTGNILNKMLGWADHYLLSIANPPPSPPVSPDLLIQPPVIGGSGAPKVPKRRPQMPSAVVTPTEWEKEFLEKNRDEIYDLLLAANYLDAKRLMDILCGTVAGLIKGKDPASIRKTFHVPEPSFVKDEQSELGDT